MKANISFYCIQSRFSDINECDDNPCSPNADCENIMGLNVLLITFNDHFEMFT